ncbi:MAG: hypothetical protein ACHQZQ_09630 [SAR324 cluster bacterium]
MTARQPEYGPPATASGAPDRAASGAGRALSGGTPWFVGAALLAASATIALAYAGDGALLERWAARLVVLQQPFIDPTAGRGEDAGNGTEYVAFLYDRREAAALDRFFRSHPAVRFVSPGLLPGMAVVRIRGDVSAEVRALREQPEVSLVLKSRLGMTCH